MNRSLYVVHDPEGRRLAQLPPDRATHRQVVRGVLAWSSAPPDDGAIVQAGLLLTGAARVVADQVRTHAARLPETDGRRLLTELILKEADRQLSQPCTNLPQVKGRARLLCGLYDRLDRLQAATDRGELPPPERR
ncbi:restriction endonuclease [Streptomyces thermogriseus]|uniref:DUF6415 family natural product biosynthesis protein n=1 Tax=Streptomyces thermogriseus TaxID=75292 RepID=A0ABP4DMA6_9ACTN